MEIDNLLIAIYNLKMLKNNINELIEIINLYNIDVNILFGCTTLSSNSTLLLNIDKINDDLKSIIPNMESRNKNAHVISKTFGNDNSFDYNGQHVFNKFNFNLVGDKVHNINIHEYLQQSNVKFDCIVLAQCNGLIGVFYGNFSPNKPYSYDFFEKSITTFYNSINENGYVIDYYYNEPNKNVELHMVDFEMFYAPTDLRYYDLHIFLVKVMNHIFTKVRNGVYKRISVNNLNVLIKDMYTDTLKELDDIQKNYPDIDKQTKIIIEKYFSHHPDKFTYKILSATLLKKLKKLKKIEN